MLMLVGNLFSQVFPDQFATSGLPNGISQSYVAQILDFNNDNLEDFIYFSDPVTSGVINKELYKNNGDGTFSIQPNFNIGAFLSYYTVGLTGWMKSLDFNSDGYPDIICQQGDSIRFFENNNGDGSFKNKSICFGFSTSPVLYNEIARNETSTDPVFLSDIDLDNDVDILFGRINSNGSRSIWMFKNELSSNGSFDQLIELIPNITNTGSTPLIAFDYDNDQDEDILTILQAGSAFTSHPLKLFRNDGNLNFVDVTATANLGSTSWWGFAKVSDLNNDGNFDVIVGSTDAAQPNRLLINNGNGTFSNNTSILETGAGNYYFGRSHAVDYDNDMDFDVNWEGSGFGFPGAPLQTNNGNFNFIENAANYNLKTFVEVWSQRWSGRITWLDVDNDGLLDHFRCKGNSAGPFLQKNSISNGNKYINIKLKACRENINALGSRIKIVCGSTKIWQTNSGANLYAVGQENSSHFHFGLGSNNVIDSIIVYWPISGITILTNVSVNQLLTIEESPNCNNSFTTGPIVNIGNDTLILCAQNTTLNVTATDATSYLWNDGSTLSSLTVDSTGLYHVLVSDANGCQTSDSIFVSVLNAEISANQNIICLGDTSVLKVNPIGSVDIWWSDGTVNIDSLVVFPLQTSEYSVIISDGIGFCNDTFNLQVNNPQINAGQDQQVCAGTQFTLTATGADTYSWDNGVINGQPFTFTTEGYYTVTGTDALGCSNTAAVYLDLISPTTSAISPTVCNTYTAPDGAVYTSSGKYTAVISNAVGCDSTITINLTVHLSITGTDTRTVCDSLVWIDGITYYSDNNSATFTVQNAFGCDSVVTLNLIVNTLTGLDAGADVTVCKGESVTLNASGAETYSWNSGVSNGVAFVPSASAFIVTGTDANGCQATDEVNVIVEDCFNIPPAFSPNGDNSNDTWKVTGLGKYPDSEIQVFDRWGQKVFSGNSSTAYWDGKLNGNELPSADYYYIITLGNGENFNGVVTLKR